MRRFLVWTDSDAVLAALKNPNSTDLRIGCLRAALNRLHRISGGVGGAGGVVVELRWVPSHAGHRLNTEADWLAEALDEVAVGWAGWARPVSRLKQEVVKTRREAFISAEAARWRRSQEKGSSPWGGVSRALAHGSFSPHLKRLRVGFRGGGRRRDDWLALGVVLGDERLVGVCVPDHTVVKEDLLCCKLCCNPLGCRTGPRHEGRVGLIDHIVHECPKIDRPAWRQGPLRAVHVEKAVELVVSALLLGELPRWAPREEKIPKAEDPCPEGFAARAGHLLRNAGAEDASRAHVEALAEGGRPQEKATIFPSSGRYREGASRALHPTPSSLLPSSQSSSVQEPDEDDEDVIFADDPFWHAWSSQAAPPTPVVPAVHAATPASARAAEQSQLLAEGPSLAAKRAKRAARRDKVQWRREERDAWIEGVRREAGQSEADIAGAALFEGGGLGQLQAGAPRRIINHYDMSSDWKGQERKIVQMGAHSAQVLPPIGWLGPWLGGSAEEEDSKARAWGVRYVVFGEDGRKLARSKRFSVRRFWGSTRALRAAEEWALENILGDWSLKTGEEDVELSDVELEEDE